MTDPNVIEAVRKLARAVALLVHPNSGSTSRAANEVTEVIGTLDALLAAEKPAAPAIVPVKFDVSHAAHGDGWHARTYDDGSIVSIGITLRPGEDAGVTTAKILAACGRGP